MRIVRKKRKGNRTVYRQDTVKGIVFYIIAVLLVTAAVAVGMGL